MARLFALMLAMLLAMPSLALAQGRDPILVPEVSQHEVLVQQGFTGQQLLLYGAILDPDGRRSNADYDIVVILRGPAQAIRIREKQRLAGTIWVNAQNTDFRSVPSFFAVASSNPIDQLVDERTASIYEFGLQYLQLSPTGTIDPERYAHFTQGLVDLRQREELFQQQEAGVTISEGVLYQARIDLPSNVVVGEYVAETFAISNGRVIAYASSDVQVRKEGFDRIVAQQAQVNAFSYGLLAVIISLLMGWAAGRLFALV